MNSLLALLREHESAVEADLAALGIDYRDRWRRDEMGRPLLTLRRVCVLALRHAPLDGNVAIAVNGGKIPWRREHHQLDDLRLVVEAANTDSKKHKAKPHPDRPDAREHKAEKRARDPRHQAKRAAALRRKRERQRAIEAGEIL